MTSVNKYSDSYQLDNYHCYIAWLTWDRGKASMKVTFIRAVRVMCGWSGTDKLDGYQKLNPRKCSKDSNSHAFWINSSTLAVFVTPPYAARARVLISSSDLEMSISDQGRVCSNSFMEWIPTWSAESADPLLHSQLTP